MTRGITSYDRLARHIEIASALVTTKVYLCDPHSWQCPSKENVSGVLRDYLPIGIDLFRPYAATSRSWAELNQRPCKVLEWDSPETRMATLLGTPFLLRR